MLEITNVTMPDGIVVRERTNRGLWSSSIDFARPDGTAQVLYRNQTPNWTSVWPAFSPDGMHIVVTASEHGGLLSIPTGVGVATS